ncbi:uncharacterized protein LOC130444148 [Diorhabda sublineata]|uniref:uncharacterized protein LOC130444148 n=1 Tax=Diorhabda sublineata TaxID=1163346 RepID=UPI0024E0CAB5|nr:uncharacterized protein LOC130444148 [Diorhabda sublineata]
MKFSFICIVSLISCSVCESNDIDVYSGLDFDFDVPKEDSQIEDYKIPEFNRLGYLYQIKKKLDYLEPELPREYDVNSVPDKHRRYQEVIDWQRSELHKHRPSREHHVNPKLQFILHNLAKSENFDLDIPPLQLPEDARMYPPDVDDGLTFDYDKDEDVYDSQRLLEKKLLNEEYRDNERLLLDNKPPVNDEHSHTSSQDISLDDIRDRQVPTIRYGYVKLAENPSEFAYPPSDPRFFRNVEDTIQQIIETTTEEEKSSESTKVVPSEVFLVNLRSDKVTPANSLQTNEDGKDGIRVVPLKPTMEDGNTAGVYIIAVVAGISAAATVGLIAVGIGWYNLQKHVKNASDVEYPAYGVTGPNKDISPSGDRRLAQSAQMYHYQHQKQQIIAMERAPPGERHGSASEAESDEENEEGDYTVYECPGLAPTGEMEVKNPLFQDDPTPAQTPATKVDDEKDNEIIKK